MLVVAPWNFSDGTVGVNNCLIWSRRPRNPVLYEWHRRMLDYYRDPHLNNQQMRASEHFKPIRHLFDDPHLGHNMSLAYLSSVFLLNTVLMCNQQLQQHRDDHVRVLPFRRWAGDIHVMVPTISANYRTLSEMKRKLWEIAMIHNFDDPTKAGWVYDRAQTIKFTTSMPYRFESPVEKQLSADSTFGRILRYAVDPSRVDLATLDGISRITPGICT